METTVNNLLIIEQLAELINKGLLVAEERYGDPVLVLYNKTLSEDPKRQPVAQVPFIIDRYQNL